MRRKRVLVSGDGRAFPAFGFDSREIASRLGATERVNSRPTVRAFRRAALAAAQYRFRGHSACDLVGTLETACLGLLLPKRAEKLRFGGFTALGVFGADTLIGGSVTTFAGLVIAFGISKTPHQFTQL